MPLKLKKTVRQMLAEANAEIETVSAEDAREGPRAFIEKRAPNYKGR